MRWSPTEPKMAVDGVRSIVDVDGQTYWVDAPEPVTAETLGALLFSNVRAEALAKLEAQAEARRVAITAKGAGKRDAYLLKYELVLRAIADPPDNTALTLITNEGAVRGLTFEQLATLVVAKRQAWEVAAMQIETAEAAGSAAIGAAVDRAAVVAAVAAASTALAGIG